MNANFNIKFNMDNSAFEDYPQAEVKRILEEIIQDFDNDLVIGIVRDINGNTIGKWQVETGEKIGA